MRREVVVRGHLRMPCQLLNIPLTHATTQASAVARASAAGYSRLPPDFAAAPPPPAGISGLQLAAQTTSHPFGEVNHAGRAQYQHHPWSQTPRSRPDGLNAVLNPLNSTTELELQ
jgi:hypothetical protein